MYNVYCGAGKLPSGKRYGDMEECAEKGEIRRYGLFKIDKRLYEHSKGSRKKKETIESLFLKAQTLNVKRKKLSVVIKDKKTKESERKKLQAEYDKMIDQIKDLEARRKILTDEKDKGKKGSRKASRSGSRKGSKKGSSRKGSSRRGSSRKRSKNGSKNGSSRRGSKNGSSRKGSKKGSSRKGSKKGSKNGSSRM